MDTDRDFIQFCGQLVFDPEHSSWEQLSPEVRERFCLLAQKNGWKNVFVRNLGKELPEKYYSSFRESYQTESLRRMLELQKLNDFYRFLESEKIPFLPIKGADLAFRVYTDQALRPHGDWDVVLREDDCIRALRMLQKNGWKTFSGFEAADMNGHHHCERMHKDRQSLEIHRTLPHFGTAKPEEIWEEAEQIDEYHHVLSPEMNLLLISAHASGEEYTHVASWKILLDAGMILKQHSIDWNKVRRLADRWSILRPDILLRVWRDFFPSGMLPEDGRMPEQENLIREIFETRDAVKNHSPYEKTLTVGDSWSFQWLRQRFRFYNPTYICRKYQIPPKHYFKIIRYGIYDFLEKLCFFLAHPKSKDKSLQNYYRKTAELKKMVTHGK